MVEITLAQAIRGRRTNRDFADRDIPISSVQRLLWAAQGISDASGKRTAHRPTHSIH